MDKYSIYKIIIRSSEDNCNFTGIYREINRSWFTLFIQFLFMFFHIFCEVLQVTQLLKDILLIQLLEHLIYFDLKIKDSLETKVYYLNIRRIQNRKFHFISIMLVKEGKYKIIHKKTSTYLSYVYVIYLQNIYTTKCSDNFIKINKKGFFYKNGIFFVK